jgi:uncharacterized protein (DUF362 family)/Pyruvate/2-oxoacid:ferredoxin oxidoreductase delta subunit
MLQKNRVAIVNVADYSSELVEQKIDEALNLLGGLGQFVQAGEQVLLKPNMLEGLPSECAVTTHPEVVRAMIRQVRQFGAVPLVGDSPGVSGTLKTAEKCGILAVCQQEKAELVPFEHSVEYPCPDGRTLKKFYLTDVLGRVDKVISLAKMKTHTFMGMTGATKNLFGCIVGVQKAQFHLRTQQRRDFAGMLVDLALLVKPVLSIVDGVTGMEGNGPRNGRSIQAGVILAGANHFAVDVVMAEIMGFKPEDLPVAALSLELGLTPVLGGIELVGEGSDVRHKFVQPRSMNSLEDRVPAWFAKGARSQLTARPVIQPNCIGCGRCVAHCPPRAMQLAGGIAQIDDEKCIRCYCCQELCPADAIQLSSGLLLKLAQQFMK